MITNPTNRIYDCKNCLLHIPVINTQITQVAVFLVVRADTDQDETETSD